MRDYLGALNKMEADTQKRFKVGETSVYVSKERNGSVKMWGEGTSVCSFGRTYEAAQHLHAIENQERQWKRLGLAKEAGFKSWSGNEMSDLAELERETK